MLIIGDRAVNYDLLLIRSRQDCLSAVNVALRAILARTSVNTIIFRVGRVLAVRKDGRVRNSNLYKDARNMVRYTRRVRLNRELL